MVRFETPHNKRQTPPHHGTPGGPSEVAPPKGERTWNSWWSRRSPNLLTNDNKPVSLGIDVGSKTVKLVAIDETGAIVFSMYHRHRSDAMTTLAELFHDAVWRYGDMELSVAITGSAGIAISKVLGVPFVQEVVATTKAVKNRYPDADCVIELGGEDAKIIYLTGNVEQRMNATCAGGTGDFIDGIASMLGVRTREISKLALGSQRTYPIASRCAVFAQTDVRPLINAGARKADIAQSALDAVARQTLGGLACGRPIKGKVVFLGGPLEHIPALVMSFRRMLGLSQHSAIKPPDAHLFPALGAVYASSRPPTLSISELERRARSAEKLEDDTDHLPPLFDSKEDLGEFERRHALEHVATKRLEDADGPLFLGFDAGSTTVKYVLVDESGTIVASDYQNVEGDTFETARSMLETLLTSLEGGCYNARKRTVSRAVVTGYGEDLLCAGLGFDSGIVETVAHLRAAQHFKPDASFVLDIGGQDMKALWIRDGQVVDAVLNEACSSGCGAFVKSSARSLRLSNQEFSRIALEAKHPVDLGSKCTVFMTSRVRHAQKAGTPREDIAAGIAYSVVNNVMTRIIGANHTEPLGDSVVVQGGTFKSDAVLRAFEKVVGVQAVRPDAAHLMGAYGAALIARDTWMEQGKLESAHSALLVLDQLRRSNPQRRSARCPGCTNACLLSIVEFDSGRHFVSGNRCERAYRAVFGSAEAESASAKPPNVAKLEQKLLASYGAVSSNHERGATTIGIMNTLNVYENMPFWHTLFARLGFSIVVPDDERATHLADRAAETVASESVCQPAKLSHLRYAYLVEAGANHVFMPKFVRGTRCPVATEYADALADNVGNGQLATPILHAIRPKKLVEREDDVLCLFRLVSSLCGENAPITWDEYTAALQSAIEEQSGFERLMATAASKALAWVRADESRRGAILAGRPYHVDASVLHRIDEELARLGFAVIPLAGLSEAQLGEREGQHGMPFPKAAWKPAKHLLGTVALASGDKQLDIVGLRSFGCGYDAVSFDEARDLAATVHRPFTELKIDDIANTAHIRIRLRTLAHTAQKTARQADRAECGEQPARNATVITPDLCSTAKALIERTLHDLDENPRSTNLQVPDVCRDCLTDALAFEMGRMRRTVPPVEVVPYAETPNPPDDGRPKVGLLGNPLLVFDPSLNDDLPSLVDKLGWQVRYPQPELLAIEDVRYLEQLKRYRDEGVRRVVYLQSFGCLKGHVQARGALHDLARRFPSIAITVVDYDPESSALNRENRIRLALSDPS